eukprot:COSAG02_NODE_624_length_19387_cov_90.736002_1_plen_237_part_00
MYGHSLPSAAQFKCLAAQTSTIYRSFGPNGTNYAGVPEPLDQEIAGSYGFNIWIVAKQHVFCGVIPGCNVPFHFKNTVEKSASHKCLSELPAVSAGDGGSTDFPLGNRRNPSPAERHPRVFLRIITEISGVLRGCAVPGGGGGRLPPSRVLGRCHWMTSTQISQTHAIKNKRVMGSPRSSDAIQRYPMKIWYYFEISVRKSWRSAWVYGVVLVKNGRANARTAHRTVRIPNVSSRR